MSVTYDHYCDRYIDLDYDSDHFDTEERPDDLDYCIQEEMDKEEEDDNRKELMEPNRRTNN
jgi:hypothetical protein